MTSRRWKDWRNSFLAGMLVVVPIGASVFVLLWLFISLTDLFLPAALLDKVWTPLYRLVALLVVAGMTTLVGWAARLVVGKRMIQLGETLIAHVPLWNKTYEFMKEISHTLLSGRKTMFQRVVAVEYPRPGIYTIAFATGESGGEVDSKTGRRLVSVFLPTPPNPTTGYLALFPRESVVGLEMSVADAMKMAFSGGAVVPPYPARTKGAE